jgi:hypothetical protein
MARILGDTSRDRKGAESETMSNDEFQMSNNAEQDYSM